MAAMNIALCQINPTIGDFDGNCARIEAAARTAAERGAELAVFSEMCVMGYPARDLLERPSFLQAHDRALARLCENLREVVPVLLGGVRPNTRGDGKPLHNSCFLLQGGSVVAASDKCLLPTYDVFDEDRYFAPGLAPVTCRFGAATLGLTICEDVWNDKNFWKQRIYPFDPVESVVGRGCDIIVNLSASPFNLGKPEVRRRMLAQIAREYARPLIYVNQTGGNDDLIFDGRSVAFDARGELLAEGPAFEEGVTIVKIETARVSVPSPLTPNPSPLAVDVDDVHRALVMGTRDYARKCGFKSAVLGLSGGIDSALVAAIAAEALGPANVTGVALPSRFNAEQSLTDARESAQRLGIHFHVIPIEEIVGAYLGALARSSLGARKT